MRAFLDTNILIYALSDDPRRETARSVIARRGVISAQVLNEFANVLRKKLRRDWDEVERASRAICEVVDDVAPVTLETHRAAITLARTLRVGVYDATIIASALEAGCDRIITEDLQDGHSVEGLTIVNPFR